jgi:hypothetical protein
VLERSLREIRAVAKLRHANIVTAYHATRIGDSIVFAIEYVAGTDLAKLVKAKGPLPVGYACNFLRPSPGPPARARSIGVLTGMTGGVDAPNRRRDRSGSRVAQASTRPALS